MAKTLSSKSSIKPAKALDAPGTQEGFSLISNEKLLAIYAAMLKCRMLEQRAAQLFQQGRLDADFHASEGHEASAAAIAIDLQAEDALSIVPGDWAPASVKGLSLEYLFHAVSPSTHNANGFKDVSATETEQKGLLVAAEEASRANMVRDRAIAARSAKKGAVVVAYVPPRADLLKPWQKVMTIAASKRLPIIFVRYAEHDSALVDNKSKNPAALVFGVPSIAADALDSVAVYRVAYEAILRARQGRGATVLECVTHNATNGSSTTAATDPVSAMEAYLKRKGIEPEPHNRQIIAEFNRDLDLATRFLNQ